MMHTSAVTACDLRSQSDHNQISWWQVVVAMIAPYRRVRTSYLATQLNIPHADVEQLLVSLILDERIRGRIDQVPWSLLPTWPIVRDAVPHHGRFYAVTAAVILTVIIGL